MTGAAEHPVLRVLRERLDSDSEPGRRSDRHRVALSIEGGGNRGVISGGMALALDEWRLLPAFDAVFGSSSGALTAAWLLSGDLATGMNAWTRPREFADYSRLSHPLRRRPLVDLDWLIMEYYDKTLGLDSDRVLANPVSLHPLATDAASGRAVDLHPYLDDRASLHRAMRASCSLPLVAGRPVAFAAGSYLDAGLSEAIPLDTPLAAGTTHLLVLSSRRDGELSRDSAVARRLLDAWLRRHAPGARDAFRTRGPRAATVAERLTRHNHEIDAAPSIMTIRPSRDAPQIGRMESDGAVLAGGLAAGHDAFQTALAGTTRFARRYPSC